MEPDFKEKSNEEICTEPKRYFQVRLKRQQRCAWRLEIVGTPAIPVEGAPVEADGLLSAVWCQDKLADPHANAVRETEIPRTWSFVAMILEKLLNGVREPGGVVRRVLVSRVLVVHGVKGAIPSREALSVRIHFGVLERSDGVMVEIFVGSFRERRRERSLDGGVASGSPLCQRYFAPR